MVLSHNFCVRHTCTWVATSIDFAKKWAEIKLNHLDSGKDGGSVRLSLISSPTPYH